MIKTLNKYDYLLPLVAVVLLFLTQRDVFPVFIFTLLVVLAGIYFFPLKDIVLGNYLKHKEKYRDYWGLIANFVLMALFVMSVYLFFSNSNKSTLWIIRVLTLLNFGFLVYFYLKDNHTKRSIVHLCFMFFAAGLLA